MNTPRLHRATRPRLATSPSRHRVADERSSLRSAARALDRGCAAYRDGPMSLLPLSSTRAGKVSAARAHSRQSPAPRQARPPVQVGSAKPGLPRQRAFGVDERWADGSPCYGQRQQRAKQPKACERSPKCQIPPRHRRLRCRFSVMPKPSPNTKLKLENAELEGASQAGGATLPPAAARCHVTHVQSSGRSSLSVAAADKRSASRAAQFHHHHLLRADLKVSARLSQKRCAGCRTRPPTGTKNIARATSAAHAISQGPSCCASNGRPPSSGESATSTNTKPPPPVGPMA